MLERNYIDPFEVDQIKELPEAIVPGLSKNI